MAKTAEFHTLLRNYRGIMGNIRINNFWISFDSCFFNYYADDDEIQFNLAGQEGVVTIPSVISYDKVDEEDLFEDAVAGYTATLESGDTVTFYCFNARIRGDLSKQTNFERITAHKWEDNHCVENAR